METERDQDNIVLAFRWSFIACLLTSAASFILYRLTNNNALAIVFLPIFALYFCYLPLKGIFKPLHKIICTVLLILLLILCFIFFRVPKEEPKLEESIAQVSQEDNMTEENKEEESAEEENEEATTEKDDKDKTKVTKGKLSSNKKLVNPYGDGMTTTYLSTGGSPGTLNGMQSTITGGPTTFEATGADDQYQKKVEEEVKEAERNGDKVVKDPSGVYGINDNNKNKQEEPPKDESKKTDVLEENKNIQDTTNTTPPKPEELQPEDPNKDIVQTPSDEAQEEAKEITPPSNSQEDTTDKVEQEKPKEPEATKPVEKPSAEPQQSQTPQVQEPVEPPAPASTPVSISPLSGTAYAGETVQFKVDGDVASVNGLDGLSHSLSGGYLSVSTTSGETTVITPVVVGVDGSTASASVTVNAIN